MFTPRNPTKSFQVPDAPSRQVTKKRKQESSIHWELFADDHTLALQAAQRRMQDKFETVQLEIAQDGELETTKSACVKTGEPALKKQKV